MRQAIAVAEEYEKEYEVEVEVSIDLDLDDFASLVFDRSKFLSSLEEALK